MKTRVQIPVKFRNGKVEWADVKGAGSGCVKVIQEMATHTSIANLGPATDSMNETVVNPNDQTVDT